MIAKITEPIATAASTIIASAKTLREAISPRLANTIMGQKTGTCSLILVRLVRWA